MFDKFGPALQRALAETRAANPAEATRLIQQALMKTPRAAEDEPGHAHQGGGSDLRRARKGWPRPSPACAAVSPRGTATRPASRSSWTARPSSGARAAHIIRQPRLQALRPGHPPAARPHPHAARLQAECGGLCHWNHHERRRRSRRLPGGLSGTGAKRQPVQLLELVPSRRPIPRAGEPHILAEMTRTISAEYGIPTSRTLLPACPRAAPWRP